MNRHPATGTALALAALLLAGPAGADSLAERMDAPTVRVICLSKEGNPGAGSGFVVGRGDFVVTNHPGSSGAPRLQSPVPRRSIGRSPPRDRPPMQAIEFETVPEHHSIRLPDGVPSGVPLRVVLMWEPAVATGERLKDLFVSVTEGLTDADLTRFPLRTD